MHLKFKLWIDSTIWIYNHYVILYLHSTIHMLHAKTIEGWLFWTKCQLHRHIGKQIWLPCTNNTMVYSFHPIEATVHKRTWFDLRVLDKKNWYVIRHAIWCALGQWWINYLTRVIAPLNVFKKKNHALSHKKHLHYTYFHRSYMCSNQSLWEIDKHCDDPYNYHCI